MEQKSYKPMEFLNRAGHYRSNHLSPHAMLVVSLLMVASSSQISKSSDLPSSHFLLRLKVSDNRRFLVTEDNKPFFWLGDTAWWIRRIAPDDIDLYMSNRAGHGFNVIQVHPGYNVTNYADEHPFVNNDTDTPNEAFWNKMDMVVAKAHEHKLYIALVPMWGNEYGKAFGSDSAKAQRFGRWLGNRYVNHSHVLWIVSGEYDAINGFKLPITETQKAVLNAMAQGLRDAHNGKQLMISIPGLSGRLLKTSITKIGWILICCNLVTSLIALHIKYLTRIPLFPMIMLLLQQNRFLMGNLCMRTRQTRFGASNM